MDFQAFMGVYVWETDMKGLIFKSKSAASEQWTTSAGWNKPFVSGLVGTDWYWTSTAGKMRRLRKSTV